MSYDQVESGNYSLQSYQIKHSSWLWKYCVSLKIFLEVFGYDKT